MNQHRTPFASRLAAFAASLLVTLGTLAAIHHLAGVEGASPLMARVQAVVAG